MNDKQMEAHFKGLFSGALALPNDAVEWLCDFGAALQLFDDVADGDPVERADLNRVLWSCLVGMNRNMFWLRNRQDLLPIVEVLILKWQASDEAEQLKLADERSYMWRAGYYDLILMVYYICHGEPAAKSNARIIMSLYGEKYQDYMKEFDNV